MHAAAARYVSVSELYSTDEVELLLDEIRDLEPTSCRGEDIQKDGVERVRDVTEGLAQDFEIAGSGAGAASGARSPAGTERSWDSHAHYTRAPPPPPRPLAPVYCRCRQLATLQGAFMLLIALSSLASASCVWAGAGLQTWALPGAARFRLLQLAALTSALLHGSLLLLRVTGLGALLPLRWDKLDLAAHVWGGGALLAGGAGALRALQLPDYRPAPAHLLALLYTASGLGLAAACLCCALAGLHVHACARALAPPPAPSSRGGGGAGSARGSHASHASHASLRAAYRAVPQPGPSSARHDPL